jgi:hypothetical protein
MIGKRQGLRLLALTAGLLGVLVCRAALAATITVNSLADTSSPGFCVMRDAITAANTKIATNGCAAGNGRDTIKFRVSGTIALVSTLPEATDSQLTINGPSAPGITIMGSLPVGRVLEVAAGATLSLNNLSIADGFSLIRVDAAATLNLNHVSITNGVAISDGAGIDNAGTLTVVDSVISGNEAEGPGGGIFNDGVLTVTKSTFSGNIGDGGGGILNDVGATLTVSDSTFTGNISLHGGAGALSNGGTMTVINSTFLGNRCAHSCTAGIFNGGVLTVTNSTFSSNMGDPAGIFNFSGSASIKSTILASSTFPPPPFGLPSANCDGAITDAGYNISDDSTCGFTKTGSANNGDGVNPLLSTAGLTDNGGPTQTIALQSGSPAIDAIPLADCTDQSATPSRITVDQRGFPRTDARGEPACDIGAYESGF